MRIVIDLQGAQTESRYRGIGRYSLSISKELVRLGGKHEFIIALNGAFPDSLLPIRREFTDLLPQANIRVWESPGPTRESQPENAQNRRVGELVREAFLASLRPDIVFVTSLFEGYIDDAITSIGRFDRTTLVACIQYDLIPLVYPEHYLEPNPNYNGHYRQKLDYVKEAHLLLAISRATAEECHHKLSIPRERIRNIGAAASEVFTQHQHDCEHAKNLRQKHGVLHDFILYTGGSDQRKNLSRLLEAYRQLPIAIRDRHQLMLAGHISEGEKDALRKSAIRLGLGAEAVIFTGYVSDHDLAHLYGECRAFVFPSWHEGFGLPALEAMACGAPVIASNTSSLPEVVGRTDALFDPYDVGAIAKKIERVLTDDAFRTDLIRHGRSQAQRFSWSHSARSALEAFEAAYQTTKKPIAKPSGKHTAKPTLAYVSPLPPARTGIADYSTATATAN